MTDAAPETTAPYGTGPRRCRRPAVKRVRVHHLQAMKERGERWAMLTAYDQLTAEIFDEAGIPVLLVGDSAANNVLGYETTLPVTVDELLPLVRAVSRGRTARAGRRRPAVRLLPGVARAGAGDGGPVHEGGRRARGQARGRRAPSRRRSRRIVAAGHPGDGAHRLHAAERARPRRLPGAGPRRRRRRAGRATPWRCRRPAPSRSCWRWCPADVAERVTAELTIPTIGIGAGADCDAQVLVWQDMAGLRTGPMPRFVKQYADLRTALDRGGAGRSPTTSPPGRTPARSTPSTERGASRGGAARHGQHGPVDSERVQALRELLGGSGWVERTREFAATLRRSSTTPGGLLLVGTPDRGAVAPRRAPRRRVAARRRPRAVADPGALVPAAGGTAAPVGDVGAARGRAPRRDGVRRRTRRRTGAAARTRRRCTTSRRDHPVDRRRRRRARFVGARPDGGAVETTTALVVATVDADVGRHGARCSIW